MVDAGLGVEAFGADAALAIVAALGGHRSFHSYMEICIVEDDKRRVAAEIKTELHDLVSALARQDLAGGGRTLGQDDVRTLAGRPRAL